MAEDENVLSQGKSSLGMALLTASFGLVLLGGLAALMLVLSDRTLGWLIASGVFIGLGLFLFLWQWLDWRKRWFRITEFGIDYRWGVISINSMEVPFDGIWGVGLRRGLFHRVTGLRGCPHLHAHRLCQRAGFGTGLERRHSQVDPRLRSRARTRSSKNARGS
jgi:hypothetical protein